MNARTTNPTTRDEALALLQEAQPWAGWGADRHAPSECTSWCRLPDARRLRLAARLTPNGSWTATVVVYTEPLIGGVSADVTVVDYRPWRDVVSGLRLTDDEETATAAWVAVAQRMWRQAAGGAA